MKNKNKRHKPFIGLAGNIGVGKTTFTKTMSERCGWQPFYESVSDNPYLNDFYKDMKDGVLICRYTFFIKDLRCIK